MRKLLATIALTLAAAAGLTAAPASSWPRLTQVDSGWELHVDVVELRRVPDTASVLATYRRRPMSPVTWRATSAYVASSAARRTDAASRTGSMRDG